jgi:hypothetical protein
VIPSQEGIFIVPVSKKFIPAAVDIFSKKNGGCILNYTFQTLTMKQVDTHTNFSFLITDDAYDTMIKILRFPSVTGPQINNQLCRITAYHDLQLSIKQEFLEEYKNDEVLQVRLSNDSSRDFIVMKSLVQHINEPEITEASKHYTETSH